MGAVNADPKVLRELAAELRRAAKELIEFAERNIKTEISGWEDAHAHQFSAIMKKMRALVMSPGDRLYECSDRIDNMADKLEAYKRAKF